MEQLPIVNSPKLISGDLVWGSIYDGSHKVPAPYGCLICQALNGHCSCLSFLLLCSSPGILVFHAVCRVFWFFAVELQLGRKTGDGRLNILGTVRDDIYW